jgi:hypothetical protein
VRSLALLLLAAGALLVLVVGSGLAVRPSLWRAGPDFLARAIAIGLGTGAATLLPAAVAGLAYKLAAGLSGGWATLGIGPVRLWARLAPLWVFCTVLGLVLSFVVEPLSWAGVGDVRGVPLAARVSWERLEAGGVLTLGDGGWLRRHSDGALELRARSGQVRLTAGRFTPQSATTSWDLENVTLEIRDEGAGVWALGRMSLSMQESDQRRYLAAPTSPWALPMNELAAVRGGSDRAARVWFRRWLQVLSIPLLSLALWLLALPRAPRRTPTVQRVPLVTAVLSPAFLGIAAVLSFFFFLRFAEQVPAPLAVLVLPLLPPLALIARGLKR